MGEFWRSDESFANPSLFAKKQGILQGQSGPCVCKKDDCRGRTTDAKGGNATQGSS